MQPVQSSGNPRASALYTFQPLSDQDRTTFWCGVPEFDRYLLEQASQDARRKVAAPFLLTDATGSVLGYYTLSAYTVQSADLPASLAKKLPRYPLLPATLLGRLAVSDKHRGLKLGRLLLMDSLRRSWENTVQIASVGVIAEAYNDAAKEFYLHHEFAAIPGFPRKFFIAMKTIEKAFA
jgi:GNAT superfamily N-acetyltransferase